MAVQNTDPNATNNPGARAYGTTAASSAGASTGNQQAESGANNYADFSSWRMNNVGVTGPVSKVLGSEDVMKLKERIEKIYQAAGDKQFTSFIIPLDKMNYYSSITIAMVHSSDPRKMAFFTLIVEATNLPPEPLTETYMNEPVRVLRTTTNVYDALFVQRIEQHLRANFENMELYNAGSLRIPRDFDTTNDTMVQNVAHEASFAIVTELAQRASGFKDFTLAAAGGDTNLVADVRFQRTTEFPVINAPVRSDVKVNFYVEAARTNKRTESLNAGGGAPEVFGTGGGFIDAMWFPAPTQTSAWGAPLASAPTQTFMARLVLTELTPEKLATLSAILLLLVSSAAISIDHLWINAFRRDHRRLDKSKGIDPTDFGAFNIEANTERNANNVGTRFNTDPADMDERDFYQAIQTMFHPNLAISMDVDKLGAKGWALDTFRAAANGDQEAIKLIYAAAVELTKGHMASFFKPEDPIFVGMPDLVHMGHFVNQEGEVQDVRAIDHLAVLNYMGEKDPDAGRRWSESWNNTNRPVAVRMNDRLNIIEAITRKVTITDIAERLTFSGLFIDGLQKASHAAGLRLSLRAPVTNNVNQNQRTAAGYAGSAGVSGQAGNGLFGTPGYAGGNAGSGNPYDSYNRFNRG